MPSLANHGGVFDRRNGLPAGDALRNLEAPIVPPQVEGWAAFSLAIWNLGKAALSGRVEAFVEALSGTFGEIEKAQVNLTLDCHHEEINRIRAVLAPLVKTAQLLDLLMDLVLTHLLSPDDMKAYAELRGGGAPPEAVVAHVAKGLAASKAPAPVSTPKASKAAEHRVQKQVAETGEELLFAEEIVEIPVPQLRAELERQVARLFAGQPVRDDANKAALRIGEAWVALRTGIPTSPHLPGNDVQTTFFKCVVRKLGLGDRIDARECEWLAGDPDHFNMICEVVRHRVIPRLSFGPPFPAHIDLQEVSTAARSVHKQFGSFWDAIQRDLDALCWNINARQSCDALKSLFGFWRAIGSILASSPTVGKGTANFELSTAFEREIVQAFPSGEARHNLRPPQQLRIDRNLVWLVAEDVTRRVLGWQVATSGSASPVKAKYAWDGTTREYSGASEIECLKKFAVDAIRVNATNMLHRQSQCGMPAWFTALRDRTLWDSDRNVTPKSGTRKVVLEAIFGLGIENLFQVEFLATSLIGR